MKIIIYTAAILFGMAGICYSQNACLPVGAACEPVVSACEPVASACEPAACEPVGAYCEPAGMYYQQTYAAAAGTCLVCIPQRAAAPKRRFERGTRERTLDISIHRSGPTLRRVK